MDGPLTPSQAERQPKRTVIKVNVSDVFGNKTQRWVEVKEEQGSTTFPVHMQVTSGNASKETDIATRAFTVEDEGKLLTVKNADGALSATFKVEGRQKGAPSSSERPFSICVHEGRAPEKKKAIMKIEKVTRNTIQCHGGYIFKNPLIEKWYACRDLPGGQYSVSFKADGAFFDLALSSFVPCSSSVPSRFLIRPLTCRLRPCSAPIRGAVPSQTVHHGAEN